MVLVPCYYCHCILWNLHVCMSGWVVPPEHICACIQENHRQKCRLIRLGLSELRIRGGATGTQVYDEDTFDFTFHNTCSPLQIEIFYFSTLQLHMIEVNLGEHRFTSILIYCMFVCLLDFVWKLLMFSHAYITWSMFRYNFAHISTSMSTLVVSFCLLWQLSFFEKVLTFFMNSCSRSSISKSAEKQSNWHIF